MQAPPPPPQKSNNVVLWVVLAVVGVCGCGGLVVLAAVLFPVFSQAKLAAKKSLALSNVKQTGTALLLYAVDNNERYPIASRWMDLTEPYSKNSNIYKSPEATPDDTQDYGFAFRTEHGQKKMADYDDPQYRALIFDSSFLSRNATSGLETLPSPGRYWGQTQRGNMVGFMDSHAKFVLDGVINATASDGKPSLR